MKKKKKYKINKARFTLFICVCLVLAALIVMLITGCDRNSSDEPKPCKHNFEKGVCTLCGEKCEHDYKDGKCAICGMEEDPKLSWPDTSTKKSEYPLKVVSDDMLVLVNKQYHVADTYIPNDMVVVQRSVEGVGDPSQYTNCMRKAAADALNSMFDAAEQQGLYLKLRTGYRSYNYQVNLFNSYAANHGEAEANKYSAKAGESEHQTGLACDLGAASQGYILSDDFGDTQEGKWVKENCWQYGFILRYTDGTLTDPGKYTGYVYEAWHIRYVGREAAKIIYDNNWTLEEYLQAIESAKQ